MTSKLPIIFDPREPDSRPGVITRKTLWLMCFVWLVVGFLVGGWTVSLYSSLGCDLVKPSDVPGGVYYQDEAWVRADGSVYGWSPSENSEITPVACYTQAD